MAAAQSCELRVASCETRSQGREPRLANHSQLATRISQLATRNSQLTLHRIQRGQHRLLDWDTIALTGCLELVFDLASHVEAVDARRLLRVVNLVDQFVHTSLELAHRHEARHVDGQEEL